MKTVMVSKEKYYQLQMWRNDCAKIHSISSAFIDDLIQIVKGNDSFYYPGRTEGGIQRTLEDLHRTVSFYASTDHGYAETFKRYANSFKELADRALSTLKEREADYERNRKKR